MQPFELVTGPVDRRVKLVVRPTGNGGVEIFLSENGNGVSTRLDPAQAVDLARWLVTVPEPRRPEYDYYTGGG